MTATVLSTLYDGVVARFLAELGAPAAPEQLFGWTAPQEQMRGVQRIVWIPGDAGGNLGTLGAPRFPGQFPRTIANLEELCTVEITALDDAAPNDQRKQYEAARNLYDAWFARLYREAMRLKIGVPRIVTEVWATGDRARRMGETIRVVFSVPTPIVDRVLETTSTRADEASIDVEELDVTENLTVIREEP